ncbi:MAG: YciI family protein [Gemmatimonadales bacterium]
MAVATALPVSIPGSPERLSVTHYHSTHLDAGGAMRYLCLIYDEEKKLGAMSKSESDSFMGEYFAFTDGIRKSGHYLGGEALQPVQTATTVRLRNGRVSTTDGPFAETKEQLGGYYLIDARDLNDAIQVASRIPSARLGSIEVRPIMEFDHP